MDKVIRSELIRKRAGIINDDLAGMNVDFNFVGYLIICMCKAVYDNFTDCSKRNFGDINPTVVTYGSSPVNFSIDVSNCFIGKVINVPSEQFQVKESYFIIRGKCCKFQLNVCIAPEKRIAGIVEPVIVAQFQRSKQAGLRRHKNVQINVLINGTNNTLMLCY